MWGHLSQHVRATEELMRKITLGDSPDHLGEIACEHLQTGGKRLRAKLALAVSEALGGDLAMAVPWAASCELLHNATLIHDDLQDGDQVRRNQPTTWVKYGPAQAINAGDLLWMAPFIAIAHIKPDNSVLQWKLSKLMAIRATAVVRGQAAELEINQDQRFDQDEYLSAIRGKTSALFQLPVEGAALLSGLSGPSAAELARIFLAIGSLFQMQDDVLDLFGDKGRDERGGDIREGKVSALIISHAALHPQDEDWLKTLLGKSRDATSQEEIDSAIGRFESNGALTRVCKQITHIKTSVLEDQAFSRYPSAKVLAQDLIHKILEPIAHVIGQQNRADHARPN